MQQRVFSVPAILIISMLSGGCGGDEAKYEPKPAVSGQKAALPDVPNVPKAPLKNGDNYSVWGASYSLRSRVHRESIAGKKISISGYITKTNLAEAPECAVHKAGKADEENCKPPVPTFWTADKKDAPESESMKVLGWASNYAQIFEAIKAYDKDEKAEYTDEFWAAPLPNPLPGPGAKVTVTGTYSTTFVGASAGAEADPIMGILHYEKMQYQEPPPEKATLPGLKRK